MADPKKRLAMLEQLTASGKADSFAWYALALEYKNAGQIAPALATFERLRSSDAAYLPMYLMAGAMLSEAGRASEARTWLEQGSVLARARGDAKALGELGEALAQLDS
jgi:tetratricopeptide (TPR) repeat protein